MAQDNPGFKAELLHLDYRGKAFFQQYLSFYQDDKSNLLFALLFWVIKYSPMWVTPIITANIINTIQFHPPDTVRILITQGLIGAFFILQNVPMHTLYIRYLSIANRSVEMQLRSSLCLRLQHLSIPFHKNNKMGELQTKVLRDVENVELLTRMLVDNIPAICVNILVALTVTAIRAPRFLLFYACIVPVAILIHRLTIERMIRYNREFRQNVEGMSGKVIEMLSLISVTRAHNVENLEMSSVNRKLRAVKDSGLRLDMLNAIYGSINWVAFMVFNLITLCSAAYLSYSGLIEMGLGDIVLLTGYFNTISNSILGLMGLVPSIAKGFESVRSISEVLECPDIERNSGKPQIHSLDGGFEFRNLCYRYDEEEPAKTTNSPLALDHINLSVKKGETIAFVGPSGSGKSTLMQLLVGFIRPTSGQILVDGKDMESLDLRAYRRFLSVVSQESILFDGTIRENITYGARANVTEEEIREAVRNANLDDFISSLPAGLDTMCKENGGRLSGGQKQRMAIARALLRDPQVLLLDEATSALDVESEAMIQEALERLIKGRTTFIVAHRLSTIRHADRIVVLSSGKIREVGSHAELMAMENGVYARMSKLQSQTISSGEAMRIGRELESLHTFPKDTENAP